MANFLVVVSAPLRTQQAGLLFRRGLEASKLLGLGPARVAGETEWARAASIPRPDGSGASLIRDPVSEDWLLTAGTWFHAEGYSCGSEGRLLHAISEKGPDEVARELEGFFVVVHGCASTREVRVICDIAGSFQAFTRVEGGIVAIASSSLLLATLSDGRIDAVAAQELIAQGVIYEDRTLHREVKKLRGARVHRFPAHGAQTARAYWAPPAATLSSRDAADGLWDALVRASNRIASLHPRVVCDLTGGRDSRAVVAGFLGSRRPFSTAVVGADDSPDVRVSKSIATRLGLEHVQIQPDEPSSFAEIKAAIPFTDGEYDLVEYSRILATHRSLSRSWDVSVNGSLGELARGYWHDVASARGPIDVRRLARLRLSPPFDASVFRPASKLDFEEHMACAIDRTLAGLERAPSTTQVDAVYLFMRMQRWQGRIASATNRLWPCLSPFLLRSVLDAALAATPAARRKSLLVRRMLARHERRLAMHPLDDGTPALPVSPLNAWRFWRAPVRDARKVLEKTGLLAKSSTSARIPARIRLWLDDEARELLQPRRMRAAEILEPSRLDDFFDRSRRREFAHDGQWSRILTLETTLALVARVRTNLGTVERLTSIRPSSNDVIELAP